MNHLNSYNESVRDLMTPKTKDELNIPMRKLFKEDPIQFFYKYHMTYSEMNVIFSEEEIRSVMDKFTESLSWAIVNVNSEELKEVVWYLYKNNYVFIRVGARDFLFKHKTRDIEHGGYFQVNRSTTLNDVKSFIEGLNESIRDLMTPKSKEDIKRDLMKLSPEDKVERGTQYNNVDLIKMGVDEGGDKEVALRWACHHGNKELAEKLLDSEVSPDTYLALSQAVIWGHIDIVKMLLEAGANPHADMNNSFKEAAAKYSMNSDMLNLLNQYANKTIEDLPDKEDILFDEDNDTEVVQEFENIKSYDEFLFEYLDNIQKLSGIMIVVDNKILLVKPRKFIETPEKWSIPKGKIDKSNTTIENAIRELEEETGIILPKGTVKETGRTRIFYKKSGTIKELVTYIIRLDKEDLAVDMNKKWEVHKKHFDTDEVYKAKFFTKQQAIDKIELGQMPLLKFM